MIEKRLRLTNQEQWNMSKTWKKDQSATDKSRVSYSDRYVFSENRVKTEFNINSDSFDFTKLSKREKTSKIINYFKKYHGQRHNFKGYLYFFSFYPFSYASVIFEKIKFLLFIQTEHKEFLS